MYTLASHSSLRGPPGSGARGRGAQQPWWSSILLDILMYTHSPIYQRKLLIARMLFHPRIYALILLR